MFLNKLKPYMYEWDDVSFVPFVHSVGRTTTELNQISG